MIDLDLRLVRYVVAVVEEGHFGRAARRLFISTPALSQQIRKLERQLGVTLLDRTRQPVEPTEVGRRFLVEAQQALAAARRAVGVTAGHARARQGTLRLGFISGAAGPLTRLILDGFTGACDVNVDLVQLPWGQQVSAVQDGTVDACFVRPPVSAAGVRLEPVLTEPRVAVLSSGHALARRGHLVVGDLDGEVQVADDEVDEDWLRWWSADPRPDGTAARYGPIIHTMEETLETCASGRAIAITAHSVQRSYGRTDVAFVPIIDIAPCEVRLCTRDDDGSPLVSTLRQVARTAAAHTRSTTAARARPATERSTQRHDPG